MAFGFECTVIIHERLAHIIDRIILDCITNIKFWVKARVVICIILIQTIFAVSDEELLVHVLGYWFLYCRAKEDSLRSRWCWWWVVITWQAPKHSLYSPPATIGCLSLLLLNGRWCPWWWWVNTGRVLAVFKVRYPDLFTYGIFQFIKTFINVYIQACCSLRIPVKRFNLFLLILPLFFSHVVT